VGSSWCFDGGTPRPTEVAKEREERTNQQQKEERERNESESKAHVAASTALFSFTAQLSLLPLVSEMRS